MKDHRSYVLKLSSWENKAWKKSDLNGFRTHDLCDTGAVLLPTELSSQLGAGHSLWVRNIPVDGEDIKWMYKISCIYLNCEISILTNER